MNNLSDSIHNVTGGPVALTTFAQVTIALQIVIAVVIIAGNVLVLSAIAVFRSLRDVTGVFVANLAVADLIIGLTTPFQIAFFYVPALETNKYTCLLRYEIVIFACNASILSLVSTVVDRYVAITYPLNYFQIMSNKIAYCTVGLIWLVDILFALIPTFGANTWSRTSVPICLYELVIDPYYKFINCSIGLFFAFFIVTMYVRIYCIARKHIRQIQAEPFNQNGDTTTVVSKQMQKVLAIVILMFHISWLPFYCIQLTMLFPQDVTKEKVIVANFLVFLGIMNSMINPIIYAWKNKLYRRAFMKLLRMKLDDGNLTIAETITNR